jgi:hypothetical protein
LAIGKEGQNARLAARLTGYKIDIRSESQDLGLEVDEATGLPITAVTEEARDTVTAEGSGEIGSDGPEPGETAVVDAETAVSDATEEAVFGDIASATEDETVVVGAGAPAAEGDTAVEAGVVAAAETGDGEIEQQEEDEEVGAAGEEDPSV